jgi:hypothetical protein
MTDPQYHALQVRALRNSRRYLRTFQTQAERVERILDRKIGSKNRIPPSGYQDFVDAYQKLNQLWSGLAKALADGIVQF